MQIPFEFSQFAQLLHPDIDFEYDSRADAYEAVIRRMSDKTRNVLRGFIEKILEPEFSDDDLSSIWNKASPTLRIEKGDLRAFLMWVKERIVAQSGPLDR